MPEPLSSEAAMTAAAIDLLAAGNIQSDTQWSLGTFGAIADFSRDPDEPGQLIESAGSRSRRRRRVAASP